MKLAYSVPDWVPGIDSSPRSETYVSDLVVRHENPILTQFLAPIDYSKISALFF
jgi:hypothetical protein